jgi:hypothetical protein
MWRKLYESRTLGDPVEGYSLKAEGLVHYIFEKVNIAYRKRHKMRSAPG